MKKMKKTDMVVRGALPVNLFSESGQSKVKMAAMIDRVAEAMKEDQ